MSDADLLKYLMAGQQVVDPNDVMGFAQQISASNPYRLAGQGLAGARFDTRSWSPLESFGTALAQAFVGGALNNYGQQQDARQIRAVTSVLPDLTSNPLEVATPEGVDDSAFDILRLNVASKNMMREKQATSKLAELQLGNLLETQAAGDKKRAEVGAELGAKNDFYAKLGVEDPDSPKVKRQDKLSDDVTEIQKSLVGSPEARTFNELMGSVTALKGHLDSGNKGDRVADISALFSWNKVIDPGAIVREEDFNRLGQEGSLGGRAQFWFNKATTGQGLTAADRAQIARSAETELMGRYESYKRTADSLTAPLKDKYGDEAKVSLYEPPQALTQQPGAQSVRPGVAGDAEAVLSGILGQLKQPGLSFDEAEKLRQRAREIYGGLMPRAPGGTPIG